MSGWRAALRMAGREARRSRGRAALVIALIGLPVLGVTVAAVSDEMFTLTLQERLTRQLGAADAELNWRFDGPVRQTGVAGHAVAVDDRDDPPGPGTPRSADQVRALLPAGSHLTPRRGGELRVETATGIGLVDWRALDLTHPLTRGIARVTGGRPPATAGEVAVTPAAADRLAVGAGDRVDLPDDGGSYRVVGVVEFPGGPDAAPGLNDPVVVFHPDGSPVDGAGVRWLVDTPEPVGWEQVRALNAHGVLVFSRAVARDPPAALADLAGTAGPVEVPTFGAGVVIGGLAVLEIVLLAGPAFAVGARRRQRELALVAAGGGTPAQLRRIVLADGVVLSAVAAAIGIALGVAVAFAGRPLAEEHLFDARAGGYRVLPSTLAATAAVAVGTGLLAALVPAVTAARQPVVAALAGRRGATRSRRRWLVLGVAMVAAGTALAGLGAWRVSADTVLAGLVVGQLGLVLCTPTLVGVVARLGPALPPLARIALRDAARNRAAAAPAISAVMAAVAGAVAAGTVVLALNHQDLAAHIPYAPGVAVVTHGSWADPDSPATPAAVARAARETLPVAEVHQSWRPSCAPDGNQDCRQLVVVVPEEKRCPYSAGRPLSRADQRAAAHDPRCEGGQTGPVGVGIVVDDGDLLGALTGADPAELAEAARVLRDGGAVVTDERYLDGGRVTLGLLDRDRFAAQQRGRLTVPGYLLATGLPRRGAIVPPSVVRRAGREPQPDTLLVTTTRMPTQAEEDAFAAAMADLGTSGWVRRPPDRWTEAGLVVLAAAAGVVALGAAGIATGLAAADRRHDLATLGAVGASPRVRRSLSLSQSGVIAGLGTGLGMLAGLGGATAVLVGLNQRYANVWPAPEPYPITVPWPTLAALLVVPLVAMLGAGLFTRSRLPIERRPT